MQQLKIEKLKTPIKKWTKDLNSYFPEDIQMANRQEKMFNITNNQKNTDQTIIQYQLSASSHHQNNL